MNICYLKRLEGKSIHLVLCARGNIIHLLLRIIRKKDPNLYFALIKPLGLRGLSANLLSMTQIEALKQVQFNALSA